MRISSFTLHLSLLTLICLCRCNDQCDSKEACASKRLTYSSYGNELIKEIERARRNYERCESTNCSCFLNVLKDDLAPFKNGITKETLVKIKSLGVKYQIIDKKLYRAKECMFPSRCSGVEYFLNKLKDELPDTEMIINVRDWPQVSQHFSQPEPVFSFSKTDNFFDIMYPAWSFWSGGPAISLYPTGIGRWDLFRESLNAESEKWPWDKKKDIAFFRGSRTNGERDPVIYLSRRKPELVDAAYTKNQAWKSDNDTLGKPAVEEVSLPGHCQYRYLFNFRGVAASFRFKFLFLCKSLVLHGGDDWLEFFYSNLKPWVHYVPIDLEATEDDIENLLLFLRENEDISKQIATEGNHFIWSQLTIENVLCYWKALVTEYTKLLSFNPTLDDALVEIT